jgi:8-oxo-dGTP pyrophosphatase MutT (NUDIX family)
MSPLTEGRGTNEVQMRHAYYHAAGGVVIHAGKILLLDRPGRDEVRLPKGHIEDGESASEAALREVCEEAGYIHLDIVADLGMQQVEFTDPYRERRVTRDERYFLMRLQDEERIERDEKEKQFSPTWAPAADAAGRLTFETEQEFVRRALRWIEEHGLPDHAAE